MTSAAAPQLSAPTNGRKPSRSAVAAAVGLAWSSGSTRSRGAPLQQTKCSGVLPVFGSTSLAAAGFACIAARLASETVSVSAVAIACSLNMSAVTTAKQNAESFF